MPIRREVRAKHLPTLHLPPHVVLAGGHGAVALEVRVAQRDDVLPAGVVPLVELVQLPSDGLALDSRPKLHHLVGRLELVLRVVFRHGLVDVLLRVDHLQAERLDDPLELRQEVLKGHLNPWPPRERHDEDVRVSRGLADELHGPVQQLVQERADEGPPRPGLELRVQGEPPVHAAVPPDPGRREDGVVPVQEQRGVQLLGVAALAVAAHAAHRQRRRGRTHAGLRRDQRLVAVEAVLAVRGAGLGRRGGRGQRQLLGLERAEGAPAGRRALAIDVEGAQVAPVPNDAFEAGQVPQPRVPLLRRPDREHGRDPRRGGAHAGGPHLERVAVLQVSGQRVHVDAPDVAAARGAVPGAVVEKAAGGGEPHPPADPALGPLGVALGAQLPDGALMDDLLVGAEGHVVAGLRAALLGGHELGGRRCMPWGAEKQDSARPRPELGPHGPDSAA
mmetsp:Transcript_117570/g.379442  ORF Transcript_117570/g.379442 Transcript_117570/m.379442 type:complete len:447 (-) Transcript_117570:7-1347(-)